MSTEAQAPEASTDSPYIGGSDAFDDLELSAEEQALLDSEMNGEVEVDETQPAAEASEEYVPDEAPVVETTAEDVAEVEAENPVPQEEVAHGTEDNGGSVEETPVPSHTIPKARLDREIQKRRELEQRLAELETSQKVEAAVEDKPIDLSGSVDMEAITKALDMNSGRQE